MHTFSSVMCWAACDRLARIAARLGLQARADYWRRHADQHPPLRLRERLERPAQRLRRDHGRRRAGRQPAAAARGRLPARRRPALRRHGAGDRGRTARAATSSSATCRPDDFGVPENAFLVCTFWYIYALAALGRRDGGARAVREPARAAATATDCWRSTSTRARGEQWGNFVQTYSMVGLINAAIRLSIRWDQAF
ncbi:MAG: hypothetical protein MZW92_80400 [Comamonadaceae bacterium]|nr:hypothetical protein [Comamonadaceae bacterium]